jgi:hypothetical protein
LLNRGSSNFFGVYFLHSTPARAPIWKPLLLYDKWTSSTVTQVFPPPSSLPIPKPAQGDSTSQATSSESPRQRLCRRRSTAPDPSPGSRPSSVVATAPPPDIFSPPHFNVGRGGGVQAAAVVGAAGGRGGVCGGALVTTRDGARGCCLQAALDFAVGVAVGARGPAEGASGDACGSRRSCSVGGV